MRVLGVFFVVLVSSAAHAQVYKCNVDGQRVFSDRPCAKDAELVRGVGSVADSGSADSGGGDSPVYRGQVLCESQTLGNLAGLYDPGSATIASVKGGKADTVEVEGRTVMARAYIVQVNAKNRMGGYVGAQPVICYTSLDGYRLLQVNAALLR